MRYSVKKSGKTSTEYKFASSLYEERCGSRISDGYTLLWRLIKQLGWVKIQGVYSKPSED